MEGVSSRQTEPVLRLVDATVVKNGVRVLDGLTMTIRAGEHTAILGPNGAGKTSLINLLTHQDRALARDDGAPPVEVFGDSRWNIFELRAHLGIVSQDLHQRFVAGNSEGSIRGEDAVLSGLLSTYGIVRHAHVTDAMRRRAKEALARTEAAHLAEKLLNEMSTGEARRVLIARALVTTPQALVLDEPTAGLDMVARRRFLEHVSRIAREGTTIILVTHHVEDIIPEVEHVVLLRAGRVAVSGSKASVLTSTHLSTIFDAPVELQAVGDYYYAQARFPIEAPDM
jgi:iron complex transport system ATP-binding protein